MKIGVIEPYHDPYQNPSYLVKKSTLGKYRFINVTVELNWVIIQDANLPSSTDKFTEEFACCTILSIIDFFSNYDQVELAEESWDLIAFMTSLGLMQMTTLAQGAINLVV